jgi:hypothetical protein
MSGKLSIPAVAEPLVEAIRQARVFTRPTFARFIRLMAALIVTMGRRTVSRALKVMGPTLPGGGGHWSNYHRIYSQARFSMWRLAAVVVRQVVALLPADATTIVLVADDTVDGKEGDRVWAKGAHRDPVRSSRGHDHVKFGHKWLVLCVLVTLRGMARPWALPILCGLCLSPKVAGKVKQRQKTPGQVTRQLLVWLMRQLPGRRFILIGDYQVVTHQTVTFAQRHPDRVTAIGRLRGDANLYAPPANPRRRTRGGGVARKGKKIASPAERIEQLAPARQEVQWYGGQTRSVTWASETALWYDKHHAQVTPIRWVCVLGDQEAGLENAYFFSSDQALEPARLIELYASRWNIEVTFEEARALLGLETTRHWCRQSVLRVTPILLGLFTAVGLLWQHLPRRPRTPHLSRTPCYEKQNLTFADALFAVRRELWQSCLLRRTGKTQCLNHLPRSLRNVLLWHLAAAA